MDLYDRLKVAIKIAESARAAIITKVEADRLLDGQVINRRLRDGVVERYSDDMLNDRFQVTHQGIALDIDGHLIDGQHRLWAISESGVSQPLIIFTVPPEAQRYMDQGQVRTVEDISKVIGNPIQHKDSAVARSMLVGSKSKASSTQRVMLAAFAAEHAAAIQFARSTTLHRHVINVTTAPVLAVIARAYYHESRNRLMEFGAIIAGEFPKDTVADLAANALVKALRAQGSERSHDAIYEKTEAALRAFLDKRPIQKLYVPSLKDNLWPLPTRK